MPFTVVQVDDSSPLISWTGDWNSVLVDDEEIHSFQNTLHATSGLGAAATLVFRGSFLSVRGALPSCDDNMSSQDIRSVTFTLDTFNSTINCSPKTGGTTDGGLKPNITDIFSAFLSIDYEHSLHITNTGNKSLYLDEIQFLGNQPTPSTFPMNGSTNMYVLTSWPTATQPITTSLSSSAGSKALPIAAMIGIAIGGLAAVLCPILIIGCRRRRRTRPRTNVPRFLLDPSRNALGDSQPMMQQHHNSSQQSLANISEHHRESINTTRTSTCICGASVTSGTLVDGRRSSTNSRSNTWSPNSLLDTRPASVDILGLLGQKETQRFCSCCRESTDVQGLALGRAESRAGSSPRPQSLSSSNSGPAGGVADDSPRAWSPFEPVSLGGRGAQQESLDPFMDPPMYSRLAYPDISIHR